jgi:hypothetical protein
MERGGRGGLRGGARKLYLWTTFDSLIFAKID